MLQRDLSERIGTQERVGWLGRLLGWFFQASEQRTEEIAPPSATLDSFQRVDLSDQDLPAYRCPETDGPRLIAQVRPSASKRGDVYGWSRH